MNKEPMRGRRLRLLACAATGVALLAAGVCRAAPVQRRVVYGPQKGDAEFILSGGGSSDREFVSGAGSLSASIGSFLSEDVELSIRQGIGINDDETGFDIRGTTRGVLDYHFSSGQLRPFVGLSLGGAYGDDVSSSFLAGMEAGLKYYVQRKTFLFGLVEYSWDFDDWEGVTSRIEDGAMAYSVGIGFNF